jgi:hypothetical protein
LYVATAFAVPRRAFGTAEAVPYVFVSFGTAEAVPSSSSFETACGGTFDEDAFR